MFFFFFFSITPKAHNNSWMDIPTVSRGQAQCCRGHASARSVTSCSLIHLPRRGEDTHNTGRKKRRKHSWGKKMQQEVAFSSHTLLNWLNCFFNGFIWKRFVFGAPREQLQSCDHKAPDLVTTFCYNAEESNMQLQAMLLLDGLLWSQSLLQFTVHSMGVLGLCSLWCDLISLQRSLLFKGALQQFFFSHVNGSQLSPLREICENKLGDIIRTILVRPESPYIWENLHTNLAALACFWAAL